MKKTKFQSEVKFLPTNVDQKAMFWAKIDISTLSVAKEAIMEPELNFYPLVWMKKTYIWSQN